MLGNAGARSVQFNTTLQPRTITEFDQYAQKVEQELRQRWEGRQPFLSIEDSAADREKALSGELIIRPGTANNPISISDGLVHDWVGAVFIPHTTMQNVLSVLQNFDRHSKIYPSIVSSRLIRRKGNEITGAWRLQYKHPVLTVVLDVEQDAHYEQVGPGKWICRAYAKDISEVENAGTPDEKKLPPGQGRGFLWRMYAYWSLEATHNGVLAECRTLSLSRDIPPMLAWAIKPFVQSLPRDSLAATLQNTRAAVSK